MRPTTPDESRLTYWRYSQTMHQQQRPETKRPRQRTALGPGGTRPAVRGWLMRLMYKAIAATALALAVIGIFLPGLPTTVFVLIAAWAAARSSPRLHAWLLNHKVFGPLLHDWNNGQRVARNAKRTAAAVMSVAALWLLYVARPLWLAFIPIGIMAVVLAWLWRRPEPPKSNEP